MGIQRTATVNFGSTPVDTKVFTVSDAGLSGLTYAEAFFMGSDSHADNDAAAHKQAAALIQLSCDAPSGTNMNINADVLAGRVTGNFVLRYVAN